MTVNIKFSWCLIHTQTLIYFQMNRIAEGSAPFFALWVTMPQSNDEVLAYVDTTEQELMYDPETYITDYKSNLSSK